MSKIKFNFSSLIILGLMTTSVPVHADSFFDSINEKISKISQDISGKIKQHYGWDTPSTPDTIPTKVPVKAPEVTPADSARTSLAQCQKFLGLMYSYRPAYETDPKIIATIYLNAVLDFTSIDLDAKPDSDEIAERNKCVELALNLGADPNSNGEAKRENNPYSFESPTPLLRAIRYSNEVAVKMLLDHKADPNIQDSSMGDPIPLLNTALYKSQEISLDLIDAGADLTTSHLLWIAAGNAADKVVDRLIQSKKIPVNEINKFTDYLDEEGETALDSSESRLYPLVQLQKNFAGNKKISTQDKISKVNDLLYYSYPLMPKIKDIDPDAFISDLLARQQRVSNSLKSAGWTCNQKNCGIIELSSSEF